MTWNAAARRSLALAGLLVVLGLMSPSGAVALVPSSFFGISPQTTLGPADFQRAAGLHLTIRVPVYWFDIEPRPGEFDFRGLDATMEAAAAAAAAAVQVVPVVWGSPAWIAPEPALPPLGQKQLRAWRAFLAHLVRRYGTAGDFWTGLRPRRPIRAWQIWNEPNFVLFWRPRPSPAGYVRVLRGSAATIRRLDPKAQIVAAGVAPVEAGMRPWSFLRRMYQTPGAAQAFDVAALHPYAASLRALEFQVRQARQALARGGDGSKPLLITEMGVASAAPFPNPFDKGLRGQARFLEASYRLLLENRRRWRLLGAYWFTWQDISAPDPHCVFCEHAGLFDVDDNPKPSWRGMRRIIGRAASIRVR